MARKPNNLKRNAFFVVAGLTTLYFLYTLNKNKMEISPKFSEEANSKKKKESTLDKILFGLLIGGAIGSVLGLTVAPDKGKKTRAGLKKQSEKLSGKTSELLENEDAMAVVADKSKGVLNFFTDKFFATSKKEKKSGSVLDWLSDMERIPNEEEEEISQ